MALEGALRVGLQVGRGRVQAVGIRSSRPDVAGTLLSGRTRAEVQAAVPLMFSICGRSQAAASELACAAAAGGAATPEELERCRAAVAAEMLREAAWRPLLDWPRWLGETPAGEAVAAARGALGVAAPTGSDGVFEPIAHAAFGMPAPDWLALDTPEALAHWAAAGRTASARFMQRVVGDETAAQGARAGAEAGETPPPVSTALLGDGGHASWVADVAAAADADPAFARAPTWRGAPAETGALARQRADPLVRALMAAYPSRVPARLAARLRELARLLTGRHAPEVGALARAPGSGVGWVENARGLLIHLARLDGDRVTRYRIVAPTEWNFHPAGALAQGLIGSAADDRDALQQRSTRLVHSLDPCVVCEVGFVDA